MEPEKQNNLLKPSAIAVSRGIQHCIKVIAVSRRDKVVQMKSEDAEPKSARVAENVEVQFACLENCRFTQAVNIFFLIRLLRNRHRRRIQRMSNTTNIATSANT